MDWAEWALTKLKNFVEFPFRIARRNIRVTLLLFTLALILTIAYLTTNLLEQVWALANGQLTEFSVSRK